MKLDLVTQANNAAILRCHDIGYHAGRREGIQIGKQEPRVVPTLIAFVVMGGLGFICGAGVWGAMNVPIAPCSQEETQ